MTKGSSSINDFPVAPRRQRPPSNDKQVDQIDDVGKFDQPPEALFERAVPSAPSEQRPASRRPDLILPTPDARQERATAKALGQEDSRLRLHHLKQNKARESKHFVNCPLDYDTKKRLERAASDNDIKMTVIVKAAIVQFLRDNGY